MKFSSLILIIWILIFSTSGKSQQFLPVKKGGKVTWENFSLLAWNEDTVSSYQFGLTKKKFFYTILQQDSAGKSEHYYSGTYRNSPDTLYLFYSKGRQPKSLEPYLIKEASGNYVIQYFAGDKKRIFLQLQNLAPKF